MRLRQIDDGAQVKASVQRVAGNLWRVAEQLAADDELRREPPLQLPAEVPPVLLRLTGIDPEARAAVGRPQTKALLDPKRHEHLRSAVPETQRARARRYFEHRVRPNLR